MFPYSKRLWLKGLNQDLHGLLVSNMTHAAARYGHVMHPMAAIEPTVQLAEKLLATVGQGWADRVFYSDDGYVVYSLHVMAAGCEFGGEAQQWSVIRSSSCICACRSTAVEVALKMAFRKFWVDHPEVDLAGETGRQPAQLAVIGIEGGYHGDTLGAMDAVAPSPYNGPEQFPWCVCKSSFAVCIHLLDMHVPHNFCPCKTAEITEEVA